MLKLTVQFGLVFLSMMMASGTLYSDKLSSVPTPTKLLLPLPQKPRGSCFDISQTHYGPTVNAHGKGINYGPKENVSYARVPPRTPNEAIWGKPTIKFADGSTCCEELKDVRDYIDYIDQTVLKYLSLRQQFVVEAGRFKDSKQGVRAITRAVEVVKKAQTVATEFGLAPWVANVSYTATLNSFVELELCLFDEDVRKKNYAPGQRD